VPADVVTAYQQALGDRNFEAARGLLSDDFRFAGPFETFDAADDYLRTVRGLWNIVESVDIKHVSTAGDEVVVLYDMVTTTPAGTQLICEWYGIEDGTIKWIRALFDSAPFAFLREGT
jgi:SnoaL-like domain